MLKGMARAQSSGKTPFGGAARRFLRFGARRGMRSIEIDPEVFRRELSEKHGLWVPNLARLKEVPIEHLDTVAARLIRDAERLALVEGGQSAAGGESVGHVRQGSSRKTDVRKDRPARCEGTCGKARNRNRGKVGGAHGSPGELSDWRRAEFFVCAWLGPAHPAAIARKASGSERACGSSKTDIHCRVERSLGGEYA